MKNQSTLLLLFLTSMLLFSSCKKGESTNSPSPEPTTGNTDVDALVGMKAPNGFDYKTDRQIRLNITSLAPDNSPITNTIVKILNAPAEAGGIVFYTGLTDNNGQITGNINLPAYLSEVVVDAAFPGIIHNAVVAISGQAIFCTLGGSEGYSGNVVPERLALGRPMSPTEDGKTNYSFMGTFDKLGKPNYLDPVNYNVTKDFLSLCNYSFPEGKDVKTHHPVYLDNSIENTLKVTSQTDVWFNFISENASNLNSIAYFTYPTATPPQSIKNIDSLHIILPNASMKGSGGSLVSGNRVKLGRFAAGTSIGFALIANGWNGTTVGSGENIFYTVDNLNPESQTDLKRHAVLLYDNNSASYLLGFEDIRRDQSKCDNDFNDVLFSVSCTTSNALSRANVNPIDKPVDSDGDGVSDIYDQFPKDASRAYMKYYPSQNTDGILAFEDNWPYIGDYDMNDLVVGYRYTIINNSQNNAVSMNADFILKASGCSFHNGFGVEFPFASSYVQSVTGTRVTNSDVVTFSANGCENGQSKAVIIPFDDAFNAMHTNSGYNVYMSLPFMTPDTIKMTINFQTPISAATLGNAPFNPFIIINKTRGREAHLPGNTPTQKADLKLLKTGQDNTSAAQNIYYKTAGNLPWALSFSENFDHPVEGKPINTAYSRFISWAQSGGINNTNWYKDTANIVIKNIYTK
jgi:LruC domain-containing protein